MAVRLAYHANCWGPLGSEAAGVTSAAQLFYRTFGDMRKAAADIAAAGYSGIELFDGNLMDYRGRYGELKAILDDSGLALVAAYSGGNFIFDDILDEELHRVRLAAEAGAQMGAEHLVVGGGAKRAGGSRPDDLKRLAATLDKVDRIASAAGLSAHYHPHLSTIVEGPDSVREIFRLTGIRFCPDTAHLAAAGGDPAAMVREHADRITYVHLKGLRREPFGFTPLDEGDLDNGAVIEALKATGFSGWITNELDAWPDPLDGARRSHRFLTNALG
jgi:inosose dehydratase